MLHPHTHSLKLLELAISAAPAFFPDERRVMMHAEYERLATDTTSTLGDIEACLIEFGREIWPYRRAFAELHDRQGRQHEDAYLQEVLEKKGLKEKYLNFLAKGGRVEDVRQGGEFEVFFTPEERATVSAAKIDVHNRVVAELTTRCHGPEAEACTTLVSQYRAEQQEVFGLLAQLSALAAQSEKWGPEIHGKVAAFEQGWSGVERDVRAEEVRGEIDYYRGVMDLLEVG